MTVEMFSWPSLHERMCRTSWSNSGPLACQANTRPIELSRLVKGSFSTAHFQATVFPIFQEILIPPTGVSGLPDNHFILSLADTVTPYGGYQPHDDTTERSPLLQRNELQTHSAENPNKLIRRFGNYGTQPHEFIQITGLAVSTFTDDIIVSDCKLNKVGIFSANGEFRGSFTCNCSVRDVAFTRGGTLLLSVSRSDNAIMREYGVDGRYIASFGAFYAYENPFGLTVNKHDQPIVTGLRQNCVHVFTQRRKASVRFGTKGSGENHFQLPHYVTTNSRDEIIVADSANHRIKTHTLDGTFVSQFGKEGSKPGQLFYPMGLCVDRYDNIYVADANNYRVQAFSPDGRCLGFPVKDTYEYGVDVKPINVIFAQTNVLLVALRGSKFCQVHEYFWDVERFRPQPKSSFDLFSCCTGACDEDYTVSYSRSKVNWSKLISSIGVCHSTSSHDNQTCERALRVKRPRGHSDILWTWREASWGFMAQMIIHWTKNVRDHNFQYNFLGILNLTVYFNTSAYVPTIWLSFDKNLTVLRSCAQLSTAIPQNEVHRSMEDDRH